MDGCNDSQQTPLFEGFYAICTRTLLEMGRYSTLKQKLLQSAYPCTSEKVCMLIQSKIVPPEEKKTISGVLSYCFLKPYITYS